ncbi:UvrD-helicase domain-containing protein [Actinomadura keratinilytica]
MRDIVETIRRDQMELVTNAPSDILVVQGGPGTGKSAVGLHRVTWLVNNEHFKAQDILVIGPHQRFLDYVGQVLPTLGTRDVNAVQLDRLWEGEVSGADSPKARLVKSDERMAAVLRRRVESDYRPEALDSVTAAPSFQGDEPGIVVNAGSTTLRVPKSVVLGLLEQAHAGDGPFRERRDRFRGFSSTGSSRNSPTSRPVAGRPARSVATWNATAGSSASSNASGRPPAPGRRCAASTTRRTCCGSAPKASSTRTSRPPCCAPAPPPPTPIRGPSTTTSASKSCAC